MKEKEIKNFSFVVDGETISTIKCCYYGQDFNWVLVCDAFTKKEYRKMGIMKSLINIAKKYANKKQCGLYLLVCTKNTEAIVAYKNIGFNEIKIIVGRKKEYFLMSMGNKFELQLVESDFNE